MRLLFNNYRADMNQHSWKLYSKAQRKYRKEIRMARNYAWWTFCSSTEHVTNSDSLHRALSNDPNIKLDYLWLPRVDVRISRGNHNVLANYTFLQFGVTQDLAFLASAS